MLPVKWQLLKWSGSRVRGGLRLADINLDLELLLTLAKRTPELQEPTVVLTSCAPFTLLLNGLVRLSSHTSRPVLTSHWSPTVGLADSEEPETSPIWSRQSQVALVVGPRRSVSVEFPHSLSQGFPDMQPQRVVAEDVDGSQPTRVLLESH
jgi:hypothetical protein